MDAEEKRLLRAIVRKVHPDLFAGHPLERARNSESLKLLNAYLDSISRNSAIREVLLEFWVAEGPQRALVLIRAELPAWGSLGPLFYAFGLINEEKLLSGFGRCKKGAGDAGILSWLGASVDQAVRAADEHESLRSKTRELRASLEDRFKLANVTVGAEFAVSLAEQRRQIEALRTLEACLNAMPSGQQTQFKGLSFSVHHPKSDSLDYLTLCQGPGLNSRPNKSFVGEDGTLHVIADQTCIHEALASLDLDRAQILTQVASFWARRTRDLTRALRDLLGVQKVWCDARTEQSNQKFVLWAGGFFENRHAIERAIGGQQFRFALLVHCDESAPQMDFAATSSTLQVRTDTSVEQLMQFMSGSIGVAADEAAAGAAAIRQEEEEILEQVRRALGVRHLIRVCPSSEQRKVISAAKRLLENADRIRAAGIELSGASLAIDDCYEVWESGFISIPFDFQLQDLQPKLRGLLGAAAGRPPRLPGESMPLVNGSRNARAESGANPSDEPFRIGQYNGCMTAFGDRFGSGGYVSAVSSGGERRAAALNSSFPSEANIRKRMGCNGAARRRPGGSMPRSPICSYGPHDTTSVLLGTSLASAGLRKSCVIHL